jgi:hypothetical protein
MPEPLPYCQLGRAKAAPRVHRVWRVVPGSPPTWFPFWCYSSRCAVGAAVLETEPQMQAEYSTFLANNHIIQCLSEEGVDRMPCSSRVAMTMA